MIYNIAQTVKNSPKLDIDTLNIQVSDLEISNSELSNKVLTA